MGSGIAQVFARSGFSVTLQDVSPPRSIAPAPASRSRWESSSRRASCRRGARRHARPARDRGRRSTRWRPQTTWSRQSSKTSRPSGRCSARWTDGGSLKLVLASNTSSISSTLIGAATKRPDKVLGMHFMNPVPLMTLVELIRRTGDERRVDGDSDRIDEGTREDSVEALTIPASSRTGS